MSHRPAIQRYGWTGKSRLTFHSFLPHSAGRASPRAVLFMLGIQVYLDPSLADMGDHENSLTSPTSQTLAMVSLLQGVITW